MSRKKKEEDGGYGRALALLVGLAVVAVIAAAVSMGGEEVPAPPARSSAPAPLATRSADATDHHPTPRMNAGAIALQPPARYASWPRLAATYRKAAEIPDVLDGVFCYCHCSEHAGHYSLLSCYTDDHAAQCDVCLSQAEMAYDMSEKGKSLETIRLAVDATYGD